MWHVSDDRSTLQIGARLLVSFQRTLRVPDDGQTYPLPPGLGALPILALDDLQESLPTSWMEARGVVVPLYQREALWLAFRGAVWKPNALMVGVGGVNAISGESWDDQLRAEPQNYIVCPDQPWLDGINTESGRVRQFVAMPLGLGDTVEEQLTGAATTGGIQFLVFEPKPERFPDEPPGDGSGEGWGGERQLAEPVPTMGIGAGGSIGQKIYPDRYGIDTWDVTNPTGVMVHIVSTEQYRELTGEEPPPTPIAADRYVEFGLPWFDLYDEGRGDVAPSAKLTQVKSVRERDEARGVEPGDEAAALDIAATPVLELRPGGPRGIADRRTPPSDGGESDSDQRRR